MADFSLAVSVPLVKSLVKSSAELRFLVMPAEDPESGRCVGIPRRGATSEFADPDARSAPTPRAATARSTRRRKKMPRTTSGNFPRPPPPKSDTECRRSEREQRVGRRLGDDVDDEAAGAEVGLFSASGASPAVCCAWTTYSLPSMRSLPASRALAWEPLGLTGDSM